MKTLMLLFFNDMRCEMINRKSVIDDLLVNPI